MSSEQVASGLAQVAAKALFEGRSVAIRLEGDRTWEPIDRMNYGPTGPSIVEVRRIRDGHTLFIPAVWIVALDVGAEASHA
ncbi:MAG: hypothetical protein ACTHJK_09060 [Sphingomicrobium sp.]